MSGYDTFYSSVVSMRFSTCFNRILWKTKVFAMLEGFVRTIFFKSWHRTLTNGYSHDGSPDDKLDWCVPCIGCWLILQILAWIFGGGAPTPQYYNPNEFVFLAWHFSANKTTKQIIDCEPLLNLHGIKFDGKICLRRWFSVKSRASLELYFCYCFVRLGRRFGVHHISCRPQYPGLDSCNLFPESRQSNDHSRYNPHWTRNISGSHSSMPLFQHQQEQCRRRRSAKILEGCCLSHRKIRVTLCLDRLSGYFSVLFKQLQRCRCGWQAKRCLASEWIHWFKAT